MYLGQKVNYLDIKEKKQKSHFTGKIIAGKNWRFWTFSAIFSPSIISPVMIKHAIFPSKVDIIKLLLHPVYDVYLTTLFNSYAARYNYNLIIETATVRSSLVSCLIS